MNLTSCCLWSWALAGRALTSWARTTIAAGDPEGCEERHQERAEVSPPTIIISAIYRDTISVYMKKLEGGELRITAYMYRKLLQREGDLFKTK